MKKILSLLLVVLMLLSSVSFCASAALSLKPSAYLRYEKYEKQINYVHTRTYIRILGGTSIIKVKELVIPAKMEDYGYEVKCIADNAFKNYEKAETLVIENGIEDIGASAFENCENLSSVTLPNSIKTIGASAFKNDTKITAITLPDSLTTIEASTFEGCSGLKSVTFGKDLATIGEKAFYSAAFESIEIPKSVKKIESKAFAECENLTSVFIQYGVTKIASDAFEGCDKLKTIYFAGLENSWESYGINFPGIDVKCWTCKTGTEHSLKFSYTKKSANCLEKGSDVYKCENCGYLWEKYISINPDNHAFKNVTTITASTCTEKGSEIFVCDCGYVSDVCETRELGHNYKGSTTKATCTTDAIFTGTCTRCGNVTTEIKEKALGHSFNIYTYICLNCGVHVTDVCSHMCHKNNGSGTGWYRFCRFFWKLFKTNLECSCGMNHY